MFEIRVRRTRPVCLSSVLSNDTEQQRGSASCPINDTNVLCRHSRRRDIRPLARYGYWETFRYNISGRLRGEICWVWIIG
jgi:hypothetical protein